MLLRPLFGDSDVVSIVEIIAHLTLSRQEQLQPYIEITKEMAEN